MLRFEVIESFMIFALLFIVLLFCVFTGIGFVFASVFKIKTRNNPFLFFFIGFSLSGLYFLAMSIFSPLNLMTLLPVIFLGGICFFFLLKKISLKDWWDKKYFIIFLLIISLIVLLEVSSSDFGAYDTLLYHANIVSWMNSYKAVFGLANLHHRLGMNSLYLAVAAGIDVGVLNKASGVILPSLMFFSAFGCFLWEMFFCGDKKYRIFAFGILIWLVFTTVFYPNLYYDIPSMIFMALAFLEFFNLLLITEKTNPVNSLSLIMLFSATSFAIKQMGALNLFFMTVFCLYIVIKNNEFNLKSLIKIGMIPILLGIFYVWRNLIITGYPLYPLPILPFNFKWTVPFDVIQSCYTGIKYWAKMPGPNYMSVADNNFLYWFIPWAKLHVASIQVVYFVMLFLALILWLDVFLSQKNLKSFFVFFIISSDILF